MSYNTSDLLTKQRQLNEARIELELKLIPIRGSFSLAEITISTDLLSINYQLSEIDALLNTLALPEKDPSVRRDSLPTSPTVLVTGIPPKNGIPPSTTLNKNAKGESYYVSSTGEVLRADSIPSSGEILRTD